MNYFNQPRYKWIISILSIFNIILLALLWMSFQSPKKHKHDSVKIFSKELGLNEDQKEKLKVIHRNHKDKLKTILGDWKKNKIELMDALSATPPDQVKADKHAQLIGADQVKIEKSIGIYFLQLKAICNDSQKEKLNTLFAKAMHPPKHKLHKRKND